MLSRVSLFVQIGDEPNYLHWGLKQMYFGKTFFILTSVYMYACKIKLQTDSSHLQRVRSGRRETETETQTQRETETQIQTDQDRQTDSQTGRQAGIQAGMQADRQSDRDWQRQREYERENQN